MSEPGAPDIPVKIIPLGGRFRLASFDLEFVSMAHSIPESNSLIIRTELGTVLHTGDWKIDPTPVVGLPTDEAKLRALGDAGVLAMIGDSTNAVREGRSPSEAEVAITLAELIRSARGRVAVTTFASNVGRIRSVAEAAAKADREVVLVGRAMERITQVARETGYLDGIKEFRGPDLYHQPACGPRCRAVYGQSGRGASSDGPYRRGGTSGHQPVAWRPGDLFVPNDTGNEKAVMRVVNGLIEQGIEVITDRTHLIHVSGHPRCAEIEDLIGWVRPSMSDSGPRRGIAHVRACGARRRAGIEQMVGCRNGDLVRLAPGSPASSMRCPAGRLYKDGALLIEAETRTVQDRRRLAFNGIVSVAIAMNDKGEIIGEPELELDGIPDDNAQARRWPTSLMTRFCPRSNRCQGRGGAIRIPLPKRPAEPFAPRSRSNGVKSPYVMCTS